MIVADLKTLTLVIMILSFMSFALMLHLWRINITIKGPALWTLSAAISFISFAPSAFFHGSLVVFINNSGTIIGALILLEGILRFRGFGDEQKRLKYIFLLCGLAIVMAYINQMNPTNRYLFHDAAVVFICISSAVALLYKTDKTQFFVHLYAAISFSVLVPVFSYRWYLAFDGQIEVQLIGSTQHAFQTFLYIAYIPHVMGWVFGFVLALSYKMRKQLEETLEARWLQAQIQPHFIFNTLNSINALCSIDPDKMQQLVSHFGDLLRSKFDSGSFNRLKSLEEELSIAKSYLFIEKVRYGDRLNVIWDIAPDTDKFFIPTLTIQPIVENAIKHGIMNRAKGGTIEIKALKDNDNMLVIIKDDGVGMDKRTIEKINKKKFEESFGIGLTNTNKRLEKAYSTGLMIKSDIDEGTEISFVVLQDCG
ncbi:sensor histidine kinase [Jeotgalibacillus haloalkalitolerans]|uniref:Sensor histidine kinase n=1 Tax=Jeotgalibacillus haloalkalitolerans TaxID=3104292 RepID=A0ABU5KKV4_9BACL|nr:sensor histidine kinase [Jeotgalibacillus sp. HH7-29]MDZ5711345.1 sensor histidine kinase [Jeotgalibacillus sp. HH7-29]